MAYCVLQSRNDHPTVRPVSVTLRPFIDQFESDIIQFANFYKIATIKRIRVICAQCAKLVSSFRSEHQPSPTFIGRDVDKIRLQTSTTFIGDLIGEEHDAAKEYEIEKSALQDQCKKLCNAKALVDEDNSIYR